MKLFLLIILMLLSFCSARFLPTEETNMVNNDQECIQEGFTIFKLDF